MNSSGAFTTGTSPALGGAFRSRALVVLATAAVVGLLWAGKVLFVTLFFALFLSFALHPFVELLEKIRVPRALAAFFVLLLLCALVTFFIVNALDQAQAFARDWPDYERKIQNLTARARGLFSRIEEGTRRLLSEGERAGVRAVRLEEGMLDSVARVVLQVRTVFALFLYTAAIPMLAFFMLKDRDFARIALEVSTGVSKRFTQIRQDYERKYISLIRTMMDQWKCNDLVRQDLDTELAAIRMSGAMEKIAWTFLFDQKIKFDQEQIRLLAKKNAELDLHGMLIPESKAPIGGPSTSNK